MAKGVEDAPLRDDTVFKGAPRVDKSKSRLGKLPHSSSKVSQLLSKISGRNKKRTYETNYSMISRPPFTSTPDMSAEEDGPWGVDVSFVETESDDATAFDSEGTTTAGDILYDDMPVISRAVDDAVHDCADTSVPTNQDQAMPVIVPKTISASHTVTPPRATFDLDTNLQDDSKDKPTFVRRTRHAAFTVLEALLAVFVVFSSIVLGKILYSEFGRERTAPSVLCSGVQTLDSWLQIGLSKATNCHKTDTLLGQIYEEILEVIDFIIKQSDTALRYITESKQFVVSYLIDHIVAVEEAWNWLSTMTYDFLDTYIPWASMVPEKIVCYVKMISSWFISLLYKCFEILSQVYITAGSSLSKLCERLLTIFGLQTAN